MNPYIIGGGLAGWALAGLLFTQWLGLKEDLALEIRSCNNRIEALGQTGRAEAAEARLRAAERLLAESNAIVASQRRALEIASEEAERANNRPAEVREVIREIYDEDACLGAPVPPAILDRLRD